MAIVFGVQAFDRGDGIAMTTILMILIPSVRFQAVLPYCACKTYGTRIWELSLHWRLGRKQRACGDEVGAGLCNATSGVANDLPLSAALVDLLDGHAVVEKARRLDDRYTLESCGR